MIRSVRIVNYKSIPELSLDLGRITVLIGANGSGKSNILEAIALASAASQDKVDNEFLISRGIRVTEPNFMRSAFEEGRKFHSICLHITDEVEYSWKLSVRETASYPSWMVKLALSPEEIESRLKLAGFNPKTVINHGEFRQHWQRAFVPGFLPGFLIYSPENSALRTFQAEGQILPLGIRGEGLFGHLKALNSDKHRDRLVKIRERLDLIDWFESFDIPVDLSPGERSIRIRDRFLPKGVLFDQRSANEGFLFLLFYLTILISPDTPAFFSIDNVDTSLNPKLCIALLQQLAALAKEHDKQVILTTHNPAVLDGIDLHDDEQRLLVVERSKTGHTRVRRVEPRQAIGQPPVSLSEAFMRGYIGGLPKNF